MNSEVQAYIRARYPIIALQSFEEARVRENLQTVAEDLDLPLYTWSRTRGVFQGQKEVASVQDPLGVLQWFEEHRKDSLLLLLDFHPYLKDSLTIRKLRDLGHSFKLKRKNILLLSPVFSLPVELSKDAALIDIPLPQSEEIKTLISQAVQYSSRGNLQKTDVPEELSDLTVERLVDACSGLTHGEIENALAKSLVSTGTLEPRVVQDEKKQIVRKGGLLEFIDAEQSALVEVGGLENLKTWIKQRQEAFSEEARRIRLPSPKGLLLVGIPGCGKSLTALTISKLWKKPLLRLDLAKVYSSLVGSSESNIRQAIQIAETVAPSILWIDEIEKGLSGSSSGASDGGTASRIFGTLLTWMQEKKSSVFVVATANDISRIPPEFLRKGRFDEIFFIDLPNAKERKEILGNLVEKFNWDVSQLDLEEIVQKSEGYSGAEIEQVLVDARFQAFYLKTELGQSLVESALTATVPLSLMMKEKVESMRKWAVGRARPASKVLDEFGQREKLTSFQARTKSLMEVN